MMLRSLKDLEGYTVAASDGEVGNVVDLLLDDERWTVRYLVVQTGGLLHAKRVLISPMSFLDVDWGTRRFHVSLTMDKVKGSPDVDMNVPVSRQREVELSTYYGFPYYWGYLGTWGMGPIPSRLALDLGLERQPQAKPGDAHLRSAKEVRGYHVQGTDEEIGHIDDFIVDDSSWALQYLVVDTSNWWLGKRVLVAPQWASSVSWPSKKVFVDMTRRAVKGSPVWNPTAPVNREYEVNLYDYYGRPVYWAEGAKHEQSRQQGRQ